METEAPGARAFEEDTVGKTDQPGLITLYLQAAPGAASTSAGFTRIPTSRASTQTREDGNVGDKRLRNQ